jgi:hypothetical protein
MNYFEGHPAGQLKLSEYRFFLCRPSFFYGGKNATEISQSIFHGYSECKD